MQQSQAAQTAAGSEKYWAIHWHRQWTDQQPDQQQPDQPQQKLKQVSRDHLLAYLQETCYWAANKASTRFSSAQFGLSDYFQLAIAQLDKVLQGFNSEQGFDLKNYAAKTFRSFIRDYLRQRKEADICSDWSLLRKVSQKRLKLALADQGLSKADIAAGVMLWQAYKLVYVPSEKTGTRQLDAPNEETWQAIAAQYNQSRHSLANSTPLNAQQAAAGISTAATAIRSYLYPSAVSMNAARPGDDAGEFIDSFSDDEAASPMGELLATEAYSQRQQQYSQLAEVLLQAANELGPEAQQLLALYYGDTLTQKEIAAQLGIKQYAISRKLTRIKKALFQAIGQWSEQTLHIPSTPDLLKQSGPALEAWLASHYQASQQQTEAQT